MSEYRRYTPNDALSLQAPFTDALSVDVSSSDWDDGTVGFYNRGIMVGVSGDVNVELLDSDTPVTLFLTAGLPYAMRVKYIYTTGTTASNIVLLK